MNSIPLPRLILAFLIFLVAGCQKEISTDVAGQDNPTADFNIANFDNGCPSFNVYGHYLNDVALSSNETITVEVDVTKAGRWEFGTNIINGFSFYGAGTFSTMGRQLIVLYGMGKPLSPGNYAFATPGSAGTSFIIPVLNQNVVEETVGTISYFKGTIGGLDYSIDATTQGPDNIPYGFGGTDTANFSSFLVGGDYPNIPAPASISLQKNGMANFYGSTDADFKNFFKPGTYPITNVDPCTLVAHGTGFLMFLSGANGDTWSTIDGSGNQEGSSITIVGIEDGHNASGNYYVSVKTRLNLKLYSYQTGDMKELTGEMVSYFIKPL